MKTIYLVSRTGKSVIRIVGTRACANDEAGKLARGLGYRICTRKEYRETRKDGKAKGK